MLDYNLVLKSDEIYLAGERGHGVSGERANGLYARDTRHLSRFDALLNGAPLDLLDARAIGPAAAVVVASNSTFPVPAEGGGEDLVYPMTVAVEQHVTLGAELRVRFVLRNFAGRALPLSLRLTFAADFRDLFDIRGFPRRERGGAFLPPEETPAGVVLGFRDRGGAVTRTEIAFDRPAALAVIDPEQDPELPEPPVLLPGHDRVSPHPPLPPAPRVEATFAVALAHGASHELTVTVAPRPASGPVVGHPAPVAGRPARPAVVAVDDPDFGRVLDRAAADLAMLETTFPEGMLPAAGIPWYVAPFGRDSLITALQTFHLAPGRADSTLRTLAALQGAKLDPFRDEEPGKILHEARYGEMARLGEIPHTPYYGSVDATPLFVLLFAETVAWTGDERLYADLLPNVRRALEWIERHGDRDGDGLVEYVAGAPEGARIVHQGWKDSHDSLHHADGRPAGGDIALVEVQGYVYAACRRLAEVVAARGDAAWAVRLRASAAAIRRKVEDAFWMADEGCYAQALDGDKAPVRAVSSNAGHLLFCGLPDPGRAAAVAARLARPDLDSGWGIRTLSAATPTYNPMSYHNGSVWPHDNSLIAAGLHACGFADLANRIASALVAAAVTDPMARLPELYCGFARAEEASGHAPTPYPVGCAPQAWAAASSQLLIRAMLGLRVDPARRALLVNPALPPWLGEASVRDLDVLGERTALTVRRDGAGYAIEADGPVPIVGPAEIARR